MTAGEGDATQTNRPPLLVPGRNCWRIEKARRLAFLVDGAEYFGAVRQALQQARSSFCILGWDIDSRMRLAPGADDGLPETLGDFFEAILARNPRLSGRILSWDYAMLYAFEREWRPIFATGWRDHPRLAFHLDSQHPVGASHHQKVIVVDNEVAFVGGFDLAGSRWDTCEHASEQPLRVNCGGGHYGPFHDVAAVVEGPCAAALGELFEARWQAATVAAPPGASAQLPRPATDHACSQGAWPVDVLPALHDVDVAISRTEPRFAGSEGVDELRQLHLDAIASARDMIVAENQYFTSRIIADAFARRLAEHDPPELAIVAPQTQSGWLEASTMGVLRARIHAQLRASDRKGRYVLYCPTVHCGAEGGANPAGEAPSRHAQATCINVHSKVLIVDDALISVGSANLSNRSLCLDTECNLTLEANGRPDVRDAVASMRARLLGEHLGVEPEEVQAAIQREGSVHRAIAGLDRDGTRRLRPCESDLDPALDAVVPDHDVLDPEVPIDPDLLVRELVPRRAERQSLHGRVAFWIAGVVVLVAAALAWRHAGAGFFESGELAVTMERIGDSPWAWMMVPLLFVASGFALVPVSLLVALTATLFGPWLGGSLAMLGAVASAASGYAAGRWLGRDMVRKHGGRRLNHLSKRLARRGLVAVLMVRLLPIAPFTIVNLVAGASHVGWRNFLLGTGLGLAPGIVLISAFVDRATAMVQEPDVPGALGLGVVLALMVAVALFLRRRFGAPRGPRLAAEGVD